MAATSAANIAEALVIIPPGSIERQAHDAGRPSSFPWLLVFLITGAVVPPGHPVRAGLDRAAQVMSANPGRPRR